MKLVKKRRSLVRTLASWVPDFLWRYLLPVSPRMYMSSELMDRIGSLTDNNLQAGDESFSSFRYHFNNKIETKIVFSTPLKSEEKENSRIKELQKELEEIKKQIAKLMEHQCEQLQCSGYGTLTPSTEQLQKGLTPPPLSVLPPPPPPPPPPLPNYQLSAVNTPIKKQVKKQNSLPQPPINGLPCGKELLRDLKKVKLRKTEKSPGGGPLKKPKKIMGDPGDFLEAVLKRRFNLVQNSPESSIESLPIDANDSFGSGTCSSTIKVAVT